MSVKRILVIAGSDSSGGAGLEADQKVIAAHGCYSMTATTALTAQNTQGVYGIHHIPGVFVRKQIDACIDDIGVDAVKIGMLASEGTVKTVSNALQTHRITCTVVDPVMISTSGSQLLPKEAIRSLREDLLPLTTILTPNIPEAKLLLEDAQKNVDEPRNLDDLIRIAKAVQSLGPEFVLVKGGHLPLKSAPVLASEGATKDIVVDVLYGRGQTTVIETAYLLSNNTHGTGCCLASAIASNLAKGMETVQAVRASCQYVEAGIKTSKKIGHGSGPINHFHSTYTLPFAPGRFLEYVLSRADVTEVWRQHTQHAFVNRMANGTLPVDAFKNYLIQDYLYLVHFARANALAAYKAKSIDDIAKAASVVVHIHREMAMHVDYCNSFGLSRQDMENEQQSLACIAYTRYLLDIGNSEGWLSLQVSFAPCLLGYGAIARRLYDDPKTVREGNRYWKWIENYVAHDYIDAIKSGSDLLEAHAVNQSPSQIEDLVGIFIQATKLEVQFWDNGLAYEQVTR